MRNGPEKTKVYDSLIFPYSDARKAAQSPSGLHQNLPEDPVICFLVWFLSWNRLASEEMWGMSAVQTKRHWDPTASTSGTCRTNALCSDGLSPFGWTTPLSGHGLLQQLHLECFLHRTDKPSHDRRPHAHLKMFQIPIKSGLTQSSKPSLLWDDWTFSQ